MTAAVAQARPRREHVLDWPSSPTAVGIRPPLLATASSCEAADDPSERAATGKVAVAHLVRSGRARPSLYLLGQSTFDHGL